MSCLRGIVLVSLFVFPMSACSKDRSISDEIDRWFFGVFGYTVFGTPGTLTTKELHFDTGRLLGKEVVVEGKIISSGEYETHLVVKDDFGRLLVVTTELGSEAVSLRGLRGNVKILGSVERGKKGLPFVLARSISVLEKDDVSNSL